MTYKSTPMVDTLSSSARKSSSVKRRSKLDFPTLELPMRRICTRGERRSVVSRESAGSKERGK